MLALQLLPLSVVPQKGEIYLKGIDWISHILFTCLKETAASGESDSPDLDTTKPCSSTPGAKNALFLKSAFITNHHKYSEATPTPSICLFLSSLTFSR